MDPKFAGRSGGHVEGIWLETENAIVEISGREIDRRIVAEQSRADMSQLIEKKELVTVTKLDVSKKVVHDFLRTLPFAFSPSHILLQPAALSNTNRRRPLRFRGIDSLGPGIRFGAR